MCEAVTLGVITGAVVAGTGVSIVGGIQAGGYQAQVQENQAKVARWQRADALQRGAQEAGRIRVIGAKVGASALTRMAASGVDTTTGSPGNVLAASAMNVEADIETVRANAARQAWALSNQAADLGAQAKMTRRASILGAFGAGLSGLGAAAGTYASFAYR